MMMIGLERRFPADDTTPCTVFPATFAIAPTVFPAVLATVLIDPLTVPTNCAGIEIRLFANPPIVPMICDGNPRMLFNIVLYIVK